MVINQCRRCGGHLSYENVPFAKLDPYSGIILVDQWCLFCDECGEEVEVEYQDERVANL